MVEEGLASTDLYEAIKFVYPSSPNNVAALKSHRFHFNSIAYDNSSLSSTILTPSPSQPIPSQDLTCPSTPTPIILKGLQRIHKFSYDPTGQARPGHEEDIPDEVFIGVGLWRCKLGRKKADLVMSVNVNLSGDGGERERGVVEGWFEESVRSLEIKDWELFGDEE
jgi:hypothetical protein